MKKFIFSAIMLAITTFGFSQDSFSSTRIMVKTEKGTKVGDGEVTWTVSDTLLHIDFKNEKIHDFDLKMTFIEEKVDGEFVTRFYSTDEQSRSSIYSFTRKLGKLVNVRETQTIKATGEVNKILYF